jgi:protein-S-isoprenylcysteine O-methyltransferase Ste14
MILNHIILAMLWIIYCILHSLLASNRMKKKVQRRMKNYKWYRLWYTLFAFVSLILLLYYQIKMPTLRLFEFNSFIFIAGIVLSFLGGMLMLVCIRKYFMNLSGLRSLVMENFSNELQITGVHKYVRHPLYLGTFAFIWGLFLLLPYLSLFIANTVITVYTLIGMELEEKKLMIEFGDSYEQYRKTVPKLIPFLKPKRRQ